MNFKKGDYIYYESYMRKGLYGTCKIKRINKNDAYGDWFNSDYIPTIEQYNDSKYKSYGFMPMSRCSILKPENINKRI